MIKSNSHSAIVLLIWAFLVLPLLVWGQEFNRLPANFHNNLIVLKVAVSGNDTLHFYTDTGGFNFIYKSGIKKLGLSRYRKKKWEEIRLDSIFSENEIPVARQESFQYFRDKSAENDGMLGRKWFANRRWIIDYEKEEFGTISVFTEVKNEKAVYQIPLYFKRDSTGQKTDLMPRIQVEIDGDTLSFLMDTGAQIKLSDRVQEHLHSERIVAISFIVESVFQKWHTAHPDWKVIEKTDTSYGLDAPMIEVPKVGIGDTAVGPVFFVLRADPNFERLSELFMDKPVQGALGGNLLSLLHQIIIDYPAGYLTRIE